MLSNSAAPVWVFLADPHACAREGMKALLAALPGVLVVGEACDGPAALALAAESDPDVVVLEADLPGLDGAQVTARLRATRPDRRVVVLTGCERPGTARLLVGVGAAGYVLKRSPADTLVRAVLAVAGGGTFIDPAAADWLAGGGADELSEREAQVLRLIARGYSNKEIAAKVRLSVKTVETYKARAMEKLGARSRVDLVRHAVRRGWLAEDTAEPLVVEAGGPA